MVINNSKVHHPSQGLKTLQSSDFGSWIKMPLSPLNNFINFKVLKGEYLSGKTLLEARGAHPPSQAVFFVVFFWEGAKTLSPLNNFKNF